MKGMTAQGQQRFEGFQRAVAYYDEAIRIQPDFDDGLIASSLRRVAYAVGPQELTAAPRRLNGCPSSGSAVVILRLSGTKQVTAEDGRSSSGARGRSRVENRICPKAPLTNRPSRKRRVLSVNHRVLVVARRCRGDGVPPPFDRLRLGLATR